MWNWLNKRRSQWRIYSLYLSNKLWLAREGHQKILKNRWISCNFVKIYQWNESDKYILSLPFKLNISPLQSNLTKSLTSNLSLKQRFLRRLKEFKAYTKCVQEHLLLTYISLVKSRALYMILHHWIKKVFSSTTMLRVIFNEFDRVSSSLFLNYRLWSGHNLRKNIDRNSLTLSAAIPNCTVFVDKHVQQVFWFVIGFSYACEGGCSAV